jgi:hypothetical protein
MSGCHCEERSDEAIQGRKGRLDCFASLAMTVCWQARNQSQWLAMTNCRIV